MAKLINGNGNKAIWPAQDADLIASICGNVTSIAAVGSQFSYTQEDANTIGVADGVIITKEGRRIQLDAGNVDLFTIPTGQLGVTSYYIIGYKLVQNSDTTQTCETFVQKMDNATDVITENTFKGGATEVYVSLYRVTQDGMNIDDIESLLPSLNNFANLVKEELLWENPAPSDSFPTQNISLDLSKFDYIRIVLNDHSIYQIPVDENAYDLKYAPWISGSKLFIAYRSARAYSNKVTFGTGVHIAYDGTNYEDDNIRSKPLLIYGLKE